MRGRAFLTTAMALVLGAGSAAAREVSSNAGNASSDRAKATFDVVGASLASTSVLADPYAYISNPVCLFAMTGETCGQRADALYLSLPHSQALRQVPLTLNFEYDGRVDRLIGLRLHVVGPNLDRSSENIVGNLNIVSSELPNGRTRVEVANFYVPPMQLEPFDGEIRLSIELTAKTQDHELRDTVFVGVGDQTPATFVPTFSTNRLQPGNHRFGGRDVEVGYDFWSTYDTIQWLRTQPTLWVNDFSAMHSARYGARGRSILDHETHHDGRTIDLRYASGLTESDAPVLDNGCLSGSPFQDGTKCTKSDGILYMLEMAADASTEESNKTPERQEARERAQDWVEANRTLLTNVADDAEIIYVGRGPIFDALVHGRYKGRRLLTSWAPGAPTYLREWTQRPSVVRGSADHNDHWHLVLRDAD